MTNWNASFTLDKRFAFIDAISSVVGLAISVIELAVAASCSNLGQNGLEFFIELAIITAIFFEPVGALLAQFIGCSRTLLLSVAMKALAHFMLLCAVLFAVHNAKACAWIFLVIEAIINSTATGGIIASYKPSYGLWYSSQNKKSIDLLGAFAHYRLLRAIGPIIVWAAAFIFVQTFATSAPEIWVPTILLLIAMAIRVFQFVSYKQDLGLIFDLDRPTFSVRKNKFSILENTKRSFDKGISWLQLVFKDHYRYALYYIYGNLIFLVEVSYLLGEISRTFVHQGTERSAMIMLGILAGLLVNLFSSFIGAKYYPVLSSWAQFRLFCAATMVIAILSSIALAYGIGFLSVFALIAIALMFHLMGVGIVRYISTAFMRISSVSTQSIFFSVTEILSSIMWLIVVLALVLFDNHFIGISLMVILFAVIGVKFFLGGQWLDRQNTLNSNQ